MFEIRSYVHMNTRELMNNLQVKEHLLRIAKHVEETQASVLQYQLFEELIEEEGNHILNTKLIVHINCKSLRSL